MRDERLLHLDAESRQILERLVRAEFNTTPSDHPNAVKLERMLYDLTDSGGGARIDVFSADSTWYVTLVPRGYAGPAAEARKRIATLYAIPEARLRGECTLVEPDAVLAVRPHTRPTEEDGTLAVRLSLRHDIRRPGG